MKTENQTLDQAKKTIEKMIAKDIKQFRNYSHVNNDMIESYQGLLHSVRSCRYHLYNDMGVSGYMQLEDNLATLSEALEIYNDVNAKLKDIGMTPDEADFTTYNITEAFATMDELKLPFNIACILSGLQQQTFSQMEQPFSQMGIDEDISEFTPENLLSDIYGILNLAYKEYLHEIEILKYSNLLIQSDLGLSTDLDKDADFEYATDNRVYSIGEVINVFNGYANKQNLAIIIDHLTNELAIQIDRVVIQDDVVFFDIDGEMISCTSNEHLSGK